MELLRCQKLCERLGNKPKLFCFLPMILLSLKKVQKPVGRLSGIARRVSSPPMSAQELNEEIAAYREEK